jgi:pimeloyl-ACP methyl ester carboxylesterase/predicted glycosyltransferase
VTIDPRGNGRSGRPTDPDSYRDERFAGDIIAVMDEVGMEQALLVGICSSSWFSFLASVNHPQRVLGVFSVATWAPYLTPPMPERARFPWDQQLDSDEGWAKDNKYYWQRDYDGYLQFFFDQLLPEPHSTKQYEDSLEWARQGSVLTQTAAEEAPLCVADADQTKALLQRVTCPVIAVHGDEDYCQPVRRSELTAELTNGRFVRMEGAGHLPQGRHPVFINRLLHEFLDEVAPVGPVAPRHWRTSMTRQPRALFLSSPIGLGHARRDLAIAQSLREQRPELQIDWLTQPPVSTMLAREGEHLHPAARWLANESAHVESECGEHSLDAFQAIRRMDEILVNNFMVFEDVVRDKDYDLVVADEAWDVDHFLHENPELKRQPFAWLTDFVGWLPFPEHGPEDVRLTRDYNAEMVEHIARYPRLRDRSVFVGEPDDCLPESLGWGLPGIREWTEAHFDFSGYITGFEPISPEDRAGVRAELGYRPDEQVCIVTVGGSGVGVDLLKRVVATYPYALQQVPGLRMVVVAGPRIDPSMIAPPEGVTVHRYVHNLWRHLAVCDLAVVQGGLTTTMELVANQRPFLYVPLRDHFEQQFHVSYRLDRHRAGRRTDYEDLRDPELFAKAIGDEMGREVDYVTVPGDGARRAATLLADLF